jgi:hypothetical protein
LGGYTHFNWIQVVTRDDETSNILLLPYTILSGLTYCAPGYVGIGDVWIATTCGVVPGVPYIDPPRGEYAYQGASVIGPVQDNLDWYEDELYTAGPPFVKADPSKKLCTELESAENADFHCSSVYSNRLDFQDMPSCQIPIPFLGGCTVKFSTTLVGVSEGPSPGDALNIGACQTGVPLTCQNGVGTGFDWHVVGTTIGIDQRRQNFQRDPGTAVFFDGFKLPGAAGFTQPELELFAKSGINIRDEAGVVKPVIIDIKPHDFPNSINPYGGGTIPVALISTTTFRAPDEVDQNSLRFGHQGTEVSLAFCHPEDVNADGLPDLVCHFYNSIAGFQVGDTTGILKGRTFSGAALFGMDSIRIVSPR